MSMHHGPNHPWTWVTSMDHPRPSQEPIYQTVPTKKLRLLVVGAVHRGMHVPNAMPGVVPALLEFLVLRPVIL
ncbi:hypothetical protein PILCRDRAFT_8734 [Piloderma croceum F 1598]|uniref:Uncharacterized protein n=1 Tax=Piloderma croceum (strain F 1598) TaxID=765440 RepID=A0A0C3B548_PILCF|nr:hypothetical protein PILCRDRAFT_8734 [Piloderma croceum F 1598]